MPLDLSLERDKQRIRQGLRAGLQPAAEIKEGYPLEFDGSIFAGEGTNFVWIQEIGIASAPYKVFVPPPGGDWLTTDVKVYFKRNPLDANSWMLIDFDATPYQEQPDTLATFPTVNNQPHARAHTINRPAGFIGSDPLVVTDDMLLRFRVEPTVPASMKLMVRPGAYAGATNHEFVRSPLYTKDFTSDIPGTSGQSLLVGISIDNTGTLAYNNGTAYATDLGYVPTAALPSVTIDNELLAVVRLYNGMTTITNSEFDYTWRSRGGGGSFAATDVYRLYESDGGGPAVQVDADGDVGIGTTSPSTRLHIVYSPTAVYAGSVPSISDVTTAYINTADGANIFSGFQFNNSGNSQNRIAYFGAVSESASNRKLAFVLGTDNGSNRNERFRITGDGDFGFGATAPGSFVEFNLATEDLEIVDAGSSGATEQDWIQVQVGGNTGYIRVFATT